MTAGSASEARVRAAPAVTGGGLGQLGPGHTGVLPPVGTALPPVGLVGGVGTVPLLVGTAWLLLGRGIVMVDTIDVVTLVVDVVGLGQLGPPGQTGLSSPPVGLGGLSPPLGGQLGPPGQTGWSLPPVGLGGLSSPPLGGQLGPPGQTGPVGVGRTVSGQTVVYQGTTTVVTPPRVQGPFSGGQLVTVKVSVR